jgi:hypothetical protein
MGKRERRTVEHTDEVPYEPSWEQLELLCICDEQVE